MACLLYNTGKCLQLRMFNRPNFGVHFSMSPMPHILISLRMLPISQFFVLTDLTIGITTLDMAPI